jgi:hypothetical protein
MRIWTASTRALTLPTTTAADEQQRGSAHLSLLPCRLKGSVDTTLASDASGWEAEVPLEPRRGDLVAARS